MKCLPSNAGVVGCGLKAGTSYLFTVSNSGSMNYLYMFSSNNPESCAGLVVQPQGFYVLLLSS